MAQELLELYAAREVTPGFVFSPDKPWQQELEASFPYVETRDQLTAIRAVKDDMMKPKPMDRLVLGDVGYGKTEVAVRAAFKAVLDGKQVAVLVPTTVLAEQHFITFSQRMEAFAVKIAVLSRFHAPREQKETVSGFKKARWTLLSARIACCRKTSSSRTWGWLSSTRSSGSASRTRST